MNKYKLDRDGKVCRLVRFTEAQASEFKDVSRAKGLTMLAFFEQSVQEFLKAQAQGQEISIVPTPFATSYKALTVRMTPESFNELETVAKAEGINVGRLIATSLVFGLKKLKSSDA